MLCIVAYEVVRLDVGYDKVPLISCSNTVRPDAGVFHNMNTQQDILLAGDTNRKKRSRENSIGTRR